MVLAFAWILGLFIRSVDICASILGKIYSIWIYSCAALSKSDCLHDEDCAYVMSHHGMPQIMQPLTDRKDGTDLVEKLLSWFFVAHPRV